MGMSWDPALTEPGGRTRRLTPQGWFVKPGSVSALTEGEGVNLHAAPGMRIPADPSPSVSAVIRPVTRRPRWPRSLTWRPPNAAGGKP